MNTLLFAHEAVTALPMEIPNPGGGSAPPGIGDKIVSILGWAKWLAMGACVAGLMIAGAMMGIKQQQGRGEEHGGRVAQVLLGAAVVAGSFSIIGFMAS